MTSGKVVEDMSPQETWESLALNTSSILIDVRTDAEWHNIGMPALPEGRKNLFFISWQFAPDMRVNASFLEEMEAAGIEKGAPIYFLCRSGVRSRAAAELATAAGYGPCFNVAEGFEGIAGPDGVRHGGWRGNGLPETKPT